MALPKIVYVYEETAANGDKYLGVAREPFDAAADDGTRRLVGTYNLVKLEPAFLATLTPAMRRVARAAIWRAGLAGGALR